MIAFQFLSKLQLHLHYADYTALVTIQYFGLHHATLNHGRNNYDYVKIKLRYVSLQYERAHRNILHHPVQYMLLSTHYTTVH